MRFLLLVFAVFAAQSLAADQSTDFYTEKSQPETYCLAQNIYYEARGSTFADKVAVADVVLNRVRDTRFPNTICTVVKQSKLTDAGVIRLDQCQFSWYCDGKSDDPEDARAWRESKAIAHQIHMNNKFKGITEGATHYHSLQVDPYWAEHMQFIGQIGSHVFYRGF